VTYYFNCNDIECKTSDVKPEQCSHDIYGLLADKYTDESTINELIRNSTCFGVFINNTQIGFACITSGFTTTSHLCDFAIHEHHKNKGIETELMKAITTDCKFNSIFETYKMDASI